LKKNKISKNWINKQRRDIYVRKSKIEGYRSRAIYKLKEIDEKFKILKEVFSVIDLGAAPGSWSQYLSQKIQNGKILAIDLLEFEKINKVEQLIGDFTEETYKQKIREYFNKKVDLVVSDMAVNTTGNKNLDSIVTGELCMDAMSFAKNQLNHKGKFISKLFMGTSFNEIVSEAKNIFKDVRVFKPLSSRKDSKENFIICKILR
jgi:23S rRNA (uridine2552-2'-O)-methyltransferase|tara:strand:+ start:613 stop:1224 length:612 start_codon:yes stop_codon:yes gene_type:complete